MVSKEILALLRYLEEGVVIRYRHDDEAVEDTYLVVSEVKDGVVHGQMATTIVVNAISLEELSKKEELFISEFRPFKSQ